MSNMDVAAVLNKSASHSWEALMVAFFAIFVTSLLVWLMRQWSKEAHDREERMARRIDELETFTRETLLAALRDNNDALNRLTLALTHRPCLIQQNSVVK